MMQVKFVTVLTAAVLWLLLAARDANALTLAQSTFDATLENWSSDTTGLTVRHFATGGNPTGHISIREGSQTSGTFYFVAPSAFLGDKSAAYGGTLHFELNQAGSGVATTTPIPGVILTSAGLTLALDITPPAIFPSWTSYDVSLLSSAGWKVGDLTGPAASEAQLQQVLGALTGLKIRGEFQDTAADTGRLDNVTLNSPPATASAPEPPSIAFVGLAALFVVGMRKTTFSK